MGAGKTTLGASAGGAARAAVRRPRRARSSSGPASPSPRSSPSAARRRSARSRRRSPRTCSPVPRRQWSRSAAAPSSRSGRARLLAASAFTLLLDVDPGDAWERARRSRPAARAGRGDVPRSSTRSAAVLRGVADARRRRRGGRPARGRRRPRRVGRARAARRARPRRRAASRSSPTRTSRASTGRTRSSRSAAGSPTTHELPPGRRRSSSPRSSGSGGTLRLDRAGTLVALGGGCTTDAAGFAAATYLRGVAVGRRADDARRPGRRGDRRQDGDRPPARARTSSAPSTGPSRTVIDPALLETLPERERRQGRAELVKTRAARRGRSSTCRGARRVQDRRLPPRPARARPPRGPQPRAHVRARARGGVRLLELPHGDAVALGLLAALRLSGNDDGIATVERELAPQPVSVDRERAWAALQRDKKRAGGRIRLVLLPRNGEPVARGRAARRRRAPRARPS